jgi:hypothetical protein
LYFRRAFLHPRPSYILFATGSQPRQTSFAHRRCITTSKTGETEADVDKSRYLESWIWMKYL